MSTGMKVFLAIVNTFAQAVIALATYFIWGMSGSDEFAGFITVTRFSLILIVAAFISGIAAWVVASGAKSGVWKALILLPFACIGFGMLLSLPELFKDAVQEYKLNGPASLFQ